MKREEIVEEIVNRLHKGNVQRIADEAGVAPATLYFWMDGTTYAPRISTLVPVARALGLELTWRNARRLRRVA